MKGRPNIHQDKHVVLKAQAVFWERGFTATSLTDLTKATGAGAGSLYNTFKGGKKELFSKALRERRKDFQAFKNLAEKSDSPIQLIKAFFLQTTEAEENIHNRGCIVANTLVEMSTLDEDLKNEAAAILLETEQLYTSIIAKEQGRGAIKTQVSADVLGKSLVTFWCGINSLRRMHTDKEVLKQQVELQFQLLL